MSYSKPRWYGVGDPAAFTKGFQSAFNTNFKNASDYFAAKEKELEDYENNLQSRADELRKNLLEGKEMIPSAQKNVEEEVQKFLKESRTYSKDDSNIIRSMLSTRVNMKTKSELDKVQMSFMSSSSVLNQSLEEVFGGEKDPKTKLDRGNPLYLDYVAMHSAVREDPSSLKMQYKKGKNEFGLTVTFKNHLGETKTLDEAGMKALMEANDPAIREAINKEAENTVNNLTGRVVTEISRQEADKFKSGGGVAGKSIDAGEVMDAVIDTYMNQTSMNKFSASDPRKRDLNNDIKNNLIYYSDERKKEMLQEVAGEDSVLMQKVPEGSSNDKYEALSDLFDIERGDIQSRERAFKAIGITSEKEKNDAIEELKKLDEAMVRQYLKDEMLATGKIASRYIKRERPIRTTTKKGDVNPEDEYYARKQASTTFNVHNRLMRGDANFNDLISPGEKFYYKGGNRALTGVKTNKNGTIQLEYMGALKNVELADGTYQKKASTELTPPIDLRIPEQARQLYLWTSPEAGSAGKYPTGFSQRAFDFNMARLYSTTSEGLNMLESEDGDQWFDHVLKYGGEAGRDALIQHAARNPILYSDAPFRVGMRPSVPHWRNFYQRNKGAIDRARSTRDLEAIRN